MVLELDREIIFAARRHRGGCFGAEYEFLRKSRIGAVVVLWLIVEAGYVEGGGESVGKHGVNLVHSAGHGARRVEAVHKVLKHQQFAHTVGPPLRGHLVANRPHHHRRTVAVMLHHVGDVAFGPTVENRAVTVGRLWPEAPVVKGFDHKHHAHLVAQLHKLRRRHIVRGSHGVGAHVLEQFKLMAQGRAVDGGSERAEVVVVAHALEFDRLAVEEESLFGYVLYGAYAESGIIAVNLAPVHAQTRACRV